MPTERRWTDSEKKAFGDIIASLDKEELLFIYEETRKKLRSIIEKDTETQFKFCDRCNKTYQSNVNKCSVCGGELREFEVPFDNYFL